MNDRQQAAAPDRIGTRSRVPLALGVIVTRACRRWAADVSRDNAVVFFGWRCRQLMSKVVRSHAKRCGV